MQYIWLIAQYCISLHLQTKSNTSKDMKKNNCLMIQTEFQRKKEKKYRRVYEEFVKLSSEAGASITEITRLLMKKYDIHSASTIWVIRKRYENNN